LDNKDYQEKFTSNMEIGRDNPALEEAAKVFTRAVAKAVSEVEGIPEEQLTVDVSVQVARKSPSKPAETAPTALVNAVNVAARANGFDVTIDKHGNLSGPDGRPYRGFTEHDLDCELCFNAGLEQEEFSPIHADLARRLGFAGVVKNMKAVALDEEQRDVYLNRLSEWEKVRDSGYEEAAD